MEHLIEVRDLRSKQRFCIDDAFIDAGYSRLCGVYASAVYMSLCRHANTKQKSWPSIELIAEELAIGEKTVRRALKKLKAHRLIGVSRVRSEKHRWLRNTYTLFDKRSWVKNPPVQETAGNVKQEAETPPVTETGGSTGLPSPALPVREAKNDRSEGPPKDSHGKDSHRRRVEALRKLRDELISKKVIA